MKYIFKIITEIILLKLFLLNTFKMNTLSIRKFIPET